MNYIMARSNKKLYKRYTAAYLLFLVVGGALVNYVMKAIAWMLIHISEVTGLPL